MSAPLIAHGTYTGNAASQAIEMGFVPDFIEVHNQTDGLVYRLMKNAADGYTAISTIANGTTAVVSSNGPSPLVGSPPTTADADGVKAGFNTGSAMSADTKAYAYTAFRSG